MKYKKATAPFPLEDGMKTLVTTFTQVNGQKAQKINTTHAWMVNALTSDKMVLKEHAKCLLPHFSQGAILPRKHEINLGNLTEIELHPDYWDAYLKKGLIDEEGNLVTKEAAVKKPIEIVVEEPVVTEEQSPVVVEENPSEIEGKESAINPESEITEESPVEESISEADPGNQTEVIIESENTSEESENAPEEQASEESASTDPA